MRFFNIKLFALLVFLSMSSGIFAYTWSFSNHTNKTLVIGLGLTGAGPWDFNIVKPRKRVEFSYPPGNWYAGYCLGGIGWIEHKPVVVPGYTQDGGLDMYQPGAAMLPGHFRDTALPAIYRASGASNVKVADIIFLPNEVFQETVKASAGIGTGFDTFLCTAIALIKIANKGQCPSMISAIINWIGGLIARTTCKGRDIQIYQDPKTGEMIFTTVLG